MLLVLTLIIACVGGIAATKLKIPAGGLVGSMLCVALLNIVFNCAYLPANAKVLTQSIAGAIIGMSLNRGNIGGLRHVIKPGAILLAGLLVINIFLGLIIYKFTSMDLLTALFSSVPGGVVDITLISYDVGANTSQVAVMQLTRLVIVITLFPVMLRIVSAKYENKNDRGTVDGEGKDNGDEIDDNKVFMTSSTKFKRMVVSLSIAFAAGYIGYKFKVPAGVLSFSLIAVAIYNVKTNKVYFPPYFRRLTQICAGALIGETISMADIISLKQILVPAAILIAGCIFMNFALGFFIHKACNLDITTSLFASSPAGATDMALIADELGADGAKVSILHISRIITVVAVFPLVLLLILIIYIYDNIFHTNQILLWTLVFSYILFHKRRPVSLEFKQDLNALSKTQ